MKKEDKDLGYLYAGLGAVAFFVAGVPILDAFSTWIANVFGLQSVRLSAEAAKYSAEENGECEHTQAVGFTIPNEPDFEVDYE